MNKILTKEWLRAALIRALRTMAQSALAIIGTASALGEVDLTAALAAALLSGLLSMLTSFAGLPECK
ncbi:MAG: hypothetical protein IKZ82_13935 [Clostridia bacterium]|nr:hypothetical protein [Clostridia bacterium]